MSELIITPSGRAIHWQLLSTVSSLALLASFCAVSGARAADADQPTLWIELGGQLDHVTGQGESFSPGFLAANPNSPVLQPVTPLQAQRPVPFSFGEEGKISFQPESLGWVFSVAINYGRSSNSKHVTHQTDSGLHYRTYTNSGHRPTPFPGFEADYSDTQVHHRESHAIVDFSAGKDVGLGLFGRNSSSVFNFGVRFAQFTSAESFDIRARPDLRFKSFFIPTYHLTFKLPYFHGYHASGQSSRSFHGVGPSLSWTGSTPLVGNPKDGEAGLDWGVNAALLFGRQKAHVRHQEYGHYFSQLAQLLGARYSMTYQRSGGHNGARSVVVPNVGGFAGASYRIENFKMSLGYRADFFFGAIDGGIDTRKSEIVGFYGPFASISVGLGG